MMHGPINIRLAYVLYVCVSVHKEQLGFHWEDFDESSYSSIFLNISRIFKCKQYLTIITGTLHVDKHFDHISLNFSRMRIISGKSCR